MAGAHSRLDDARADLRADAIVSATAAAGICALVVVAPFETLRPLIALPGQSVSSVEAALFAVVVAFLASSLRRRVVPAWRTPLTLPWLAVLAAMIAAAAAAPEYRANALHMAGRLGLALCVYLVTVNAVTTFGRLRGVLAAAVLSGALAATLVVLEYVGADSVLRMLGAFRAGVAHVGAQVRAGGPFQYPTIASMFLEVVFALALGLLPLFVDRARERGRVLAIGLMAVLVLMAHAITLTFTRAGLITMASSLAVVGVLRYRQRGLDGGVKAIAALAVVIAIQFFASRSAEAVFLRLTTEGQDAWYRASVAAPPRLSLSTASTIAVPITVTNSGRTTWDPAAAQPFRLAYHWLTADGRRVVSWEGIRTLFPAPVAPGASVSLRASVQAPPVPGEYRLLWDIEQQHRLWFSTEPGASLFMSDATVSGPVLGRLGPAQLLPLPLAPVRPGRFILWRAAGRMLAARPVFGVGPDNFRLLYGRYAGLANADSRVHSNNMYIELLVGGGIVAGLALVWFFWRAGASVVALMGRAAQSRTAPLSAGVAAAVIAIALHGLVDSFLSFTGTYIVIAIALGLVVACGRLIEEARPDGRADETDANRI